MNILDISGAFNGLEQPMILQIISNQVLEGINNEVYTNYSVVGVVQPLDLRRMRITPAEQREWGSHMIHLRESLLRQYGIQLVTQQSLRYKVIVRNYVYEVVGKWMYNDYGYAEVDANQTAKS